jgi:hypothetical protein
VNGHAASAPEGSSLELGRLIIYGSALASVAAGLIHVSAAADHAAAHLPLHAALFDVTALAEVLWAALVVRRASSVLLILGVVGNIAVVVIWGLSRTTGVAFIPGAEIAEPLGFKDVTSVIFELAAIAGIASYSALPTIGRRLMLPGGRRLLDCMLATLAVLTIGALQLGAGDDHTGHLHEVASPSTVGAHDHALEAVVGDLPDTQGSAGAASHAHHHGAVGPTTDGFLAATPDRGHEHLQDPQGVASPHHMHGDRTTGSGAAVDQGYEHGPAGNADCQPPNHHHDAARRQDCPHAHENHEPSPEQTALQSVVDILNALVRSLGLGPR